MYYEKKLHKIITKLTKIINKSCLNQLESIVIAILTMSGRVTMLGISRWNTKYSYSTIERFFDKKLDWLKINYQLIKEKLGQEVILVADETTISKSGKSTHGIDYFYSGLQGRPIKGIQYLSFSLIDIKTERAYPLLSKQLRRKKKKISKKIKYEKKGRPVGVKNNNSKNVRLTGLFRIVNWYINLILKVVKLPNLKHFVYDGAFGNNAGILAAKRNGLYLISKLKKNSALHFKFDGEQKEKGRNRIYGDVIDYENIDEKYLKATRMDGKIQKNIYQIRALNKKIYGDLNVVIIVARRGKKIAHQILFSTDLNQDYAKIIKYYSLKWIIF